MQNIKKKCKILWIEKQNETDNGEGFLIADYNGVNIELAIENLNLSLNLAFYYLCNFKSLQYCLVLSSFTIK